MYHAEEKLQETLTQLKVQYDTAEHARSEMRGIFDATEEQSKLFTKFYRAENAMTREISGTGLGLWITRSLVEMLGGNIEVSSSPSKGSTFSFTLPISENV